MAPRTAQGAHETRLNDVVLQRLPRSTPQRLLQAKDCFASLIHAHRSALSHVEVDSLVAVARKWGREIGLDNTLHVYSGPCSPPVPLLHSVPPPTVFAITTTVHI
jgi:hypothetical protein